MTSPDPIPTTLSDHLRQLGLLYTADELNDLVARATQKRWSPIVLLEHLVKAELDARTRLRVERRLRDARLGRFKMMAEFEWDWPKQIHRPTVERVFTLDFLAKGENVIFVAPHGLGKTMFAKNLVYQAILAGHSARFLTASELLLDLNGQETARALERRLRSYAKPSLLAVDEIGYLGYDAHAADLLSQVVSRRYEQRSLVVTTTLLRFRKRKRLTARRRVPRSLARGDAAVRAGGHHFAPHTGAWGQRGNEVVGGLEPRGAQLRRHHGLQRFQFHRRIRARVDFRRLHVGVSEPQRDFPQSFGRLQYRERAGVSQQVREHALGRQRRASLPCGLGVLAQEVFDP